MIHELRPALSDSPHGALVLLHGRGTDELDLAPLFDFLDPARDLVGVTPRAPLQLPPGGNHWYQIEQVGRPNGETFRRSLAELLQWLGELPELTGVPWDRTVIGGFSQGAVMAYAVALDAERPAPAALLAMSGFIPDVRGVHLFPEARRLLPCTITHGAADPVIPVEYGRAARTRLDDAGLDVSYFETPGGHDVDSRLLEPLADWLAGVTG
jgi:phospholipase/carboxylesterase